MAVGARLGLVLALIFPIGYFSGAALGFPFTGLLACAMALLAWLKLDWALLTLIALAPFNRSPQSQIFSPQLVVVTKAVLVIIVGVVWWVRKGFVDEKVEVPNWLKAYLVGWGFLAVLSTLNAQNPMEAIPHLVVCLSGIVLFWVVWHSDSSLYTEMAVVLALSAMTVVFVCLLQYAMLRYQILSALWPYLLSPREQLYIYQNPSSIEPPIWRVAGTFIHANALGTFFYMLIPFGCASLSIERLTRGQKVFLLSVLVLMAAGLFVTNSRGSFLAVIVSLAYLGLHRGYRWLAGIGVLSFALLGLAFVYDGERVIDHLTNLSRVKYGLSSRSTIWNHGIELAERFPLLGVGPGNFPTQFDAHFGYFVYDNLNEIREQAFDVQMRREKLVNAFHAHNTALQVAGEYGVLALPLFFFGVIAVIWQAEKRSRRLPPGSFGRAMALGLASFCVGYLAASNFDSYAAFTEMGLLLLGAPLVAMGLKSV